MRDIGAEMARRFRQSQAGTISRALTLDEGWSAVTPNYLKVRLDRQVARNEWIDVRLSEDGVEWRSVYAPGQLSLNPGPI